MPTEFSCGRPVLGPKPSDCVSYATTCQTETPALNVSIIGYSLEQTPTENHPNVVHARCQNPRQFLLGANAYQAMDYTRPSCAMPVRDVRHMPIYSSFCAEFC